MAKTREEAIQGVANQVEALQGVINGLSRVAVAIAAIPTNQRSKAMTAVEAVYRQSALELGYSDSEARDWVTAIMFSLRTRVFECQSSAGGTSTGSVTTNLTSLSAA
ncbi:MAG: hypothetical protein WA851_10345 [Xanthobacteraceae bacterium]